MNVLLSESNSSLNRIRGLPILADGWYAFHHPDLCEPFESRLKSNVSPWLISLAKRFAIIHGWLFFLLAQKHSAIMTSTTVRGAKAFFFFEAILGKSGKHLILLEFIESKKSHSQSVLRRSTHYLWVHWILKRVLKKSLLTAHVLAKCDCFDYSELFGIPEEHFVFIPWPKRLRNDQYLETLVSTLDQKSVLSSGREACDWKTLFKAADGQGWHLKVICSHRDLPLVQELNKNGIAEVMCDVSRDDHEREVQKAAVYVLCLFEQERSSGHVRISDATRAGTPIVATAVKGIEGYIDNGETGLLVPPGDALLLSAAVNQLLADAQCRRTLAKNAFDRAASHTREDYMEKIQMLVRGTVRDMTRKNLNFREEV
jgi:glycosyltransferase involved in cell wall biosynthesis